MPPKSADKLTDAEKKKIKQANKAKANPEKAEEKAKTNLKRRIARGQIVDPAIVSDKKESVSDKKECSALEGRDPVLAAVKPKKPDIEKEERRKMKVLAIEKEFRERESQAQKERIRKLCEPTEPSDTDSKLCEPTEPSDTDSK